jgi:UDP-glucuronate decarboxylase
MQLNGAKLVEEVTLKLAIESVAGKGYFEGLHVLVTGCAGFIGSWLSEALHSLGSRVTCIDNLSTGRYDNIRGLVGSSRFTLVVGDVVEVDLGEGYDLVFHGAALPAPDYYMAKPVEAMLPDSIGFYRVLRVAERSGSKVVLMSSSEVYGDPEVIPTPESYWGRVNPVGPRSPYDESKRFAEALAMAFHREYGVRVTIARIFNTYGPRLEPGAPYARVVTRFVERALRGEPLEVHGDGSQTRSFTYVSDTVAALLTLASCSRCDGEVFNVGSDEEVSIAELAELVVKLTGSRSPIVHVKPRPDDPRRRRPDITKITSYTGWRPRVALTDGLRMTIEWMRWRVG